jgi:hypothetical protein
MLKAFTITSNRDSAKFFLETPVKNLYPLAYLIDKEMFSLIAARTRKTSLSICGCACFCRLQLECQTSEVDGGRTIELPCKDSPRRMFVSVNENH